MYPLHDNDLDRLSRNAAEYYEMDFGSPGWEQLEKRLDQELPQKKDRRRFLFWLFFIVVTTGGALTGLLINSQPVTPLAANRMHMAPSNVAGTATNNKPGTDNKKAVEQANDKDVAPANTDTDKPDHLTGPGANGNTAMDKKQSTSTNNRTVDIDPTPAETNNNRPDRITGKKDPGTSDRTTVLNDRGQGKSYRAGRDRPISMNNSGSNKPASMKPSGTKITDRKPGNKKDNDISGDQSMAQNKDQLVTTPKLVDKNDHTVPIVPPVDQPANNPNTIAGNPNKPLTTDSTAAGDKKTAIPHRYIQPLELGVVAGPDASMVSFGPLYKAGYNVGISVGYRFNERWSVNTGVIYTRKYYQADSNTFHAPKRSYISYVDLDVLKGYCAMWDIPLNVRYDISFNDKRRFFASAGASTYLMKEQNYNYWYWERGSREYKDGIWGPGSDTQYVASVLNLSLGYEKMIGKHFSIQAEPYFKIPLKGMGYGTMRIGSYGVFFSLKYRPTFKAKQPVGRK